MLILFLSILITMVKTTSIASQDISIQSKCLVNQKKSNVQYYSNYFAMCRIIWSGDTETNPGTGLSKPKCQVCDKTVWCNQKILVCEHCLEMCHVKCSNHWLNQNASNKLWKFWVKVTKITSRISVSLTCNGPFWFFLLFLIQWVGDVIESM